MNQVSDALVDENILRRMERLVFIQSRIAWVGIAYISWLLIDIALRSSGWNERYASVWSSITLYLFIAGLVFLLILLEQSRHCRIPMPKPENGEPLYRQKAGLIFSQNYILYAEEFRYFSGNGKFWPPANHNGDRRIATCDIIEVEKSKEILTTSFRIHYQAVDCVEVFKFRPPKPKAFEHALVSADVRIVPWRWVE